MSSESTEWESPSKKDNAKFKNVKLKYWILTMNDKWQIPDTLTSSIKYIRGQLECSEKNYLHWQFAIEYFKPIRFICVKQGFPTAHIETIYSISAWNYVWKEKTAVVGSQFELGDASDVLKEMKLRKMNSFVKRDEPLSTILEPSLADESMSRTTSFDIDYLEKKLIDISKSLYFLPPSALTLLHEAVDKVEMIDLQNSIEDYDALLPFTLTPTKPTSTPNRRNVDVELDISDLIQAMTLDGIEDYDALLPVTPTERTSAGPPINHGKRWEIDEISELDMMLKDAFTIKEIANHFGRSNRSIALKGASIIHEKLKRGYNLEKAILIYKNKIRHQDILKFQELKKKSDFRSFKKLKTGHQSTENIEKGKAGPCIRISVLQSDSYNKSDSYKINLSV